MLFVFSCTTAVCHCGWTRAEDCKLGSNAYLRYIRRKQLKTPDRYLNSYARAQNLGPPLQPFPSCERTRADALGHWSDLFCNRCFNKGIFSFYLLPVLRFIQVALHNPNCGYGTEIFFISFIFLDELNRYVQSNFIYENITLIVHNRCILLTFSKYNLQVQ